MTAAALESGHASRETPSDPFPSPRAQRLARRRGPDIRPTTIVGGVALLILGAVALGAPMLAPHDPVRVQPERRLQGPTALHPLGTDHIGRDVLSRTLYGTRVSLGAAALATFATLWLGLVVGACAGYFGGPLDEVVSLGTDALLALPGLTLALALAGILGPGLGTVVVALAGVSWVGYSRLFRSATLSARRWEFVEASRALGAGDWRILRRHVIPSILGPLAVLASLDFGSLLLGIAGLSFLGLGVQPPTPEWGAMLGEGRLVLYSAPHLTIVPGVCIVASVLAANLLGDGLRDQLDPWLAARV